MEAIVPPPSQRLDFNLFRLKDAAFLLDLMNQPEYYQGIADRGVRTLEQATQYIHDKIADRYQENGYGMYLLSLRKERVPIGLAGIFNRAGSDIAELGYAISHLHHKMGYASEAAQHLVDFAKNHLNLSMLGAVVNRNNPPSARILEKCGFQYKEERILQNTTDKLQYYEIRFTR
jgi:ribosomal-protein-alanine N-acetyltransferase